MRMRTRFKTDESGTTAVIFSLALLPILGLAGAAVDYSRATAARSVMQNAVDATALQLTREAPRLDDGQLQARGREIFTSFLGDGRSFSTEPVSIARGEKTVRVAATGTVKTTIMGVAGFASMGIGAVSEAAWSNKTIELALVLDNTGSMSSRNKMGELKKASHNLLASLNGAARDSETIKVSIVPFDSHVRLAPNAFRNASWLRFAAPEDRDTWRGYVADRDIPFDAGAAAPDPIRSETLYPADKRADSDLAVIRPLTSVISGYRDLKASVDSMQPKGCTNITIGTSWGLATLTHGNPLGGAKPADKNREKIMIVLTDGENTRNRFVNACGGSGRAVDIDARTRLACKSARDAGVRVYTVRVVEGNQALLRECASRGRNGEPLYYDVQDAAQLDGVFREIVSEILGTRITH